MTIDFVAIEDAINTWVAAGSGLDVDDNVIWAQQKAPRPATPYISIRMMVLERFGIDWFIVQDASPPNPGAEIEHVVQGTRTGVLNLQCFADDGDGAASAMAILENVVLAATLPSVHEGLRVAKFGILNFGPVQSINGGPTATVFEPRAIVDCRFNTTAEVVETATYIEIVKDIENLTTGETFTVGPPP